MLQVARKVGEVKKNFTVLFKMEMTPSNFATVQWSGELVRREGDSMKLKYKHGLLH